jgi:hypothetical protein
VFQTQALVSGKKNIPRYNGIAGCTVVLWKELDDHFRQNCDLQPTRNNVLKIGTVSKQSEMNNFDE